MALNPAPPDARISVIVPCYNAAPYIAEALDSLLAQDPTPDDIIVIDDGSTDASPAVVAGYGARVRYLRQDNQGIAGARNRGLELARGALIAFLDADDIWPEGSLAARLRCLDAEPGRDGAFGLTQCFISPELPPAAQATLFCPPEPQAGRLPSSLLVRREVFERVGLFDTGLQVGEFIDWAARADNLGLRMACADQVVLRRRIHSANTVLKTQRLQADYLKVLRASLARRRARTEIP